MSLDCSWRKISVVSEWWKSSKRIGLITCRRRVIDQKARLLSWRSASGILSDEVHMEEEGVQVQVQSEEEEIGETHGREQGEEKGENKQTSTQAHDMDDYADETKRAPTT